MIFIALMRLGDPVAERLLHCSTERSFEVMRKPQSRLAREILRIMAVKLTGQAETGWTFASHPDGRPLLVHSLAETVPPNVSLSHSGPWVACGISRTSVIGVDVERHRATRNFTTIAEAAFGPEERRRLLEGGIPAFYRIWTIREAIAKTTGQGLTQVTNGVDYAATGPDTGSWLGSAEGRQWGLTHLMPLPDLSLSIATPDQTHPPRWWPFGWEAGGR